MVVGIGLTAMFVPLPREFVKAGDILGIILLLAAALFVLLVLRKPKGSPDENRLKVSSGWKLINRTRSLVERLIVGFRTIAGKRFPRKLGQPGEDGLSGPHDPVLSGNFYNESSLEIKLSAFSRRKPDAWACR
jgi:hypothetical protein